MLTQLRAAFATFIVLTLITGVAYPLLVTGIAQLAFPDAANGSLVVEGNRALGSRLIGRPFDQRGYFWSRPSATAPEPYNAAASTGSNLGPMNPALHEAIQGRIASIRAAHPERTEPVPIDLVTASASGLDPHISIAAARYQADRIARERGMPVVEINALIDGQIEPRTLGVLGEPRINVLELNLRLDSARRSTRQ